MNRKKFISKLTLGSLASVFGTSVLGAKNKSDEVEKPNLKQVGFNHLPNNKETTMNTVLHKASTRGHANHGWLKSHHTFSFANYYNPQRIHFGKLRVLNDDTVSAGKGFGTHPHENMEIISIPLEGDLEHKDSMGNSTVIKEGDVQVMSAGTGVRHSEYNKNKDRLVKFLQIWVFPNKQGVKPRYDQITVKDLEKENEFYQVLSPHKDDDGVWIHQDAWFHLGKFSKSSETKYDIKKSGNGVYAFILEGNAEIQGQKLDKRDGFGIWNVNEISVKAEAGARILLMEVPMN